MLAGQRQVGRRRRVGDLQPLAVKAGLNAASTATPTTAPTRGPNNRSGWLEGETSSVVEQYLDNPSQAEAAGIRITTKGKVPPRPDGAPNRWSAAEPAPLTGMPFGH